jgi:hypothetical protein
MYRVNRNLAPTKEEKVAKKISDIVSDFSLDIEAVGYYLATSVPYITYARAVEVLEAARYNKDVAEYYKQGGYYDNKLL